MIRVKFLFFLIIFSVSSSKVYSQGGFRFYGANQIKQKVKFKLINNLIVIPLEINGKELSFILDTGLNKTILFSLTKNDSLSLRDVEKVQLQGLGDGKSIDALLSKNNTFRVLNIISNQEDLYVILKDNFDLSSKMGITIHGIIGYNLLKNIIVKINYNTKRITFYNPLRYQYKKCRKCETFPLEFYRNKPYINTKIQLDTIGNQQTEVKLLIDSGGSDAVWLFEHTKDEIVTPNKYFKDVLGVGLSGTVYGNRSKIPKLILGKFIVEKPTVSFLDSLSTYNARKFKKRNGSIGGNVLKRFKVWIDYPNKKITLKKCGSLTDGFHYNMSGLEIVYNGKVLVKETSKTKIDSYGNNGENNSTISFVTSYHYLFKPSFKINRVNAGSPAEKVGLLKGDVLISINHKKAYQFNITQIIPI